MGASSLEGIFDGLQKVRGLVCDFINFTLLNLFLRVFDLLLHSLICFAFTFVSFKFFRWLVLFLILFLLFL